ncbi:LysR family transcriptional regulator [Microvirga brassicacearum]|uniref:LysR family transcriptional regulator n=1 Tax=Microvirga brassicacearum TaxID=2580413 RepID=A0A5N3PE85_9HYPH|nr:LysR family transcriptional regulator [Microvirga brassicacearum]
MLKRELRHKHIEIFRAVIRSGSVTGARRLLGITQPGVSKLLSQTEELCGFSLFVLFEPTVNPACPMLRYCRSH